MPLLTSHSRFTCFFKSSYVQLNRKMGLGGSSICKVSAPTWVTQVLKVLGLNPAAVYWLLGFSAIGVLRPLTNWQQTGVIYGSLVLKALLLLRKCTYRNTPCNFNQFFFNPKTRPRMTTTFISLVSLVKIARLVTENI